MKKIIAYLDDAGTMVYADEARTVYMGSCAGYDLTYLDDEIKPTRVMGFDEVNELAKQDYSADDVIKLRAMGIL